MTGAAAARCSGTLPRLRPHRLPAALPMDIPVAFANDVPAVRVKLVYRETLGSLCPQGSSEIPGSLSCKATRHSLHRHRRNCFSSSASVVALSLIPEHQQGSSSFTPHRNTVPQRAQAASTLITRTTPCAARAAGPSAPCPSHCAATCRQRRVAWAP